MGGVSPSFRQTHTRNCLGNCRAPTVRAPVEQHVGIMNGKWCTYESYIQVPVRTVIDLGFP